jgi:hypothetical protein
LEGMVARASSHRKAAPSRQVCLERLLRELDRPVEERLPKDRCDLVVVEMFDPAGLRNLLDKRRLEAAARAGTAIPARDLPVVVE